jgi:hypothetical protein
MDSLCEILDKIRKEREQRSKIREEISAAFGKLSGVEFLKFLDERFDKGLIDTYIMQTRRETIIYIIPLLSGEKQIDKMKMDVKPFDYEGIERIERVKKERLDISFVVWLGQLYEALIDYHGRKCAKCGLTEEECLNKYDKRLELHHVHPIMYGDIYSVKVTRAFVPLCPKCHFRGKQ